ncbi:MAG TPA: GTP 3',8-cyclase MoaA [Candidatus Polarisedimenticolaceae bacterium]
MPLVDGFGRVHDDLRVSVTDRCNLRCAYCMPEEPEWFPREEILRYEEAARLVRVAAEQGIRKVRVTGGEPLVRRDVDVFVAAVAAIPGIDDLSLTTNGVLLEKFAPRLAAAGLRRVNVSLDSLRRDRFARLTGRDRLADVLRGLEAAAAAGLGPVKINAVLLRGINDDEAIDLVAFGRERGYEVRFIEFMPLDNDRTWDLSRVVSGASVRRALHARWPLVPDPDRDRRAPATRFLFADGGGAVGFINSVTEPFCADCGRLRLTSDGKLRVCLYDDREDDLKAAMRAGATDADLVARMQAAVSRKGRGGAVDILERREALPLRRTMHQIGG